MELKIIKEKVNFNKSQFGNSKICLFVEFPNCISTKTGKPFRWMPTYFQLANIKTELEKLERESWNK